MLFFFSHLQMKDTAHKPVKLVTPFHSDGFSPCMIDDRISMELPILYLKGLQVEISKL